MWIQRYFIVEHLPEHDQQKIIDHPTIKGERIVFGRPSIHDFVGAYHTVRLDDKHIYVAGEIKPERLLLLEQHPTITPLPSLHSSAPLLDYIEKQKRKLPHANALAVHGVARTHNVYDAIMTIATKFSHPFFYPDK